MIPEIGITCRGKRYFINFITVEQYKRYISLMEKNNTDRFADVMFYNKKIMQELIGHEISLEELGEVEVIDFLTAIKEIHITMQQVVAAKMLDIVDAQPIKKEVSAFDEYDLENGYEDEQPEENQWKVCGEIIDRVIKIAIRLLNNSYSQCMKEDVVSLLDYLKFELDTINENQ